MPEWVDVGPVEQFDDRRLNLIELGKHEVVILRVRSEVYAMRNSCPHAAAKICQGRVVPRIIAQRPRPGEGEVDADQPVVKCPWHGWEFDPRDGRALADPRMCLKVWPAKVDNERVLVEI